MFCFVPFPASSLHLGDSGAHLLSLATPLGVSSSSDEHNISQRALKHETPIQALKAWKFDKPHAFRKKGDELPGV
jgi:hypothetical protein